MVEEKSEMSKEPSIERKEQNLPFEEPYQKNRKITPCLKSPLTLYELAANAVDSLPFPEALTWSQDETVRWISQEIGFPEYEETFRENHIDGMRLILLEEPSNLTAMNIKSFCDIQKITSRIRKLYGTEFIKFSRSIGLPMRKPLTHCTLFKSRTGPHWGIRKNWVRSDILRWLQIIMPKPLYLDHWDLVWYQTPDFPKVKIARIKKEFTIYNKIPRFQPQLDICREELVPRKFKLLQDVPEDCQFIWIENVLEPEKKEEERKEAVTIKSRLEPKKLYLKGLRGKEFILTKRKMPRPKFQP